MVTLDDIRAAQERLRPYLTLPTPLDTARNLGAAPFYLKVESVNPTRSFKIRGALNAMLKLRESGHTGGVITASSGNHAQALAYAARLTGVHAQIWMPEHTPRKKVDGVRAHGGEVVLHGQNFDQTEQAVLARAADSGRLFISAYSHPDVIAGAGTIGLEIAQQLPTVGRAAVCLSGGGLISGVAVALKGVLPHCEIVGVCAQHAPAGYNVKYGTQHPQIYDTLAEALSGDIEPTSPTLSLIRHAVDRVVMVSEAAIADAVRALVYQQGWVTEGGGAVAVAALRQGLIPTDDRPTVATLSGGNIDADALRRILTT